MFVLSTAAGSPIPKERTRAEDRYLLVTRSALRCNSYDDAERHFGETHITPPRIVPDQVSGERDAGS